jgi:hypothetical protein
MATVYENLVQKAVAKGIAPDVAAAAAEAKLAKEGRSLMEMAPEEAPSAPTTRSALVQKAVAKGIAPDVAAAAAEKKIERESQKAFASAPDFAAGAQKARGAVMAEPGARDVVAEVLGQRRSTLPEIGTPEAEAVYAMPVPMAARAAAPAPTSAPVATGMVPMSELAPEQRIDVERARREESMMRAREAQRQGQQLGAVLAPYVGGATLAATRSPVAASTASFLPGLLGYASYGAERAFGSEEPGVMEMMIRDRAPVRAAPRPEGAFGFPALSFEPAASAPMPEQTLEEQARAQVRTATAGESALGEALRGAGREVVAAGRELLRPASAAREAVSGAAEAYRAFQERNRPARPLGYVNPYEGMTTPQIELAQAKAVNIPTQQNVLRRENALLAESRPQQYVPVGPPDDPYLMLAETPDAALLTEPAAFDRWAAQFPVEAEATRARVQARRDTETKVTLPGARTALPLSTIAEIARSGTAVEGVGRHVLATLAEGDPLANARLLAENPSQFFERSTQKALDMGVLPTIDQLGMYPDEYRTLALSLGAPQAQEADGSIVLGATAADALREALTLRKENPAEYRSMITELATVLATP